MWAHNAHVATSTDGTPSNQPMGTWLRAALGCRYGAIALTFGQGAFVAQIPDDPEDDLAIDTLPRAPDDTVEGVLGEVRSTGTLASWSCDASAGEVPEWLSRTPEGWLRTDPGMLAEHGGLDGFFVARFVNQA